MITIDDVADANALYGAFRLSKKGVAWKTSVQRYEMNVLRNINGSKKTIEAGESPVQGFNEFIIHERGKTRHVKSVHIRERVVQRSLCDNALVPLLSKGLEYDNSASQKGKGLHFTINRLDKHLHRYYRKHGSNEGYVLLIDFKGYYDNILHSKVYERLDRKVPDDGVRHLACQLVEPFDDGNGKSLGIGSQISQIIAIDYNSEIDRLIKHELGVESHSHYMDDFALIHENKDYLWYCLEKITEKCNELGIKINPRKTQIVKLSHGFTFLKLRWTLTSTGKVLKRPNKDSITRERRKLHKFKEKLDAGEITMPIIAEQYSSWKGDKVKRKRESHKPHQVRLNCYYTIKRMDQLYNELFINNQEGGPQNDGQTKVPYRKHDLR